MYKWLGARFVDVWWRKVRRQFVDVWKLLSAMFDKDWFVFENSLCQYSLMISL